MTKHSYAFDGVLLCALLLGAGCAGSQSSARDLQVIESASKAESMQAQRTIQDLHGEIQALQRDLGATRAAQARLEGELREAQQRVQDAQRQVDAQREELARVREERDRLVQTGREVQGQLVELGRLRQQVADAEGHQARLQAMEAAIEKQAKELADLKGRAQKAAAMVKAKPLTPELAVSGTGGAFDQPVSTGASTMSSPRTIIVKRGDTLGDLARKHRVPLAELMAVNKLASDRIHPGQELILPEP